MIITHFLRCSFPKHLLAHVHKMPRSPGPNMQGYKSGQKKKKEVGCCSRSQSKHDHILSFTCQTGPWIAIKVHSLKYLACGQEVFQTPCVPRFPRLQQHGAGATATGLRPTGDFPEQPRACWGLDRPQRQVSSLLQLKRNHFINSSLGFCRELCREISMHSSIMTFHISILKNSAD